MNRYVGNNRRLNKSFQVPLPFCSSLSQTHTSISYRRRKQAAPFETVHSMLFFPPLPLAVRSCDAQAPGRRRPLFCSFWLIVASRNGFYLSPVVYTLKCFLWKTVPRTRLDLDTDECGKKPTTRPSIRQAPPTQKRRDEEQVDADGPSRLPCWLEH